jgi:long-chain fatty acid transport protein
MIKNSVTRTRPVAIFVTTAVSTIVAFSSAYAGGFGINEQSTVGTGMAYAGVAAGGTLSDQFWNPATLGDVHGFQSETDLTAILPILDVHLNPSLLGTPAQSQGNAGIGVVVPTSNYAYRVNQNIILGLGINSPFGLATGYSGSSFLRSIPTAGIAGTSRISSIDVNPNIAYQFNDQLTIAAGLQGQYMAARETAFLVSSGILNGSTHNIGFGYTLGVDYKPMKGTSIGLGYRSGITNTINGSITGVPGGPYNGDLKLKTPGIATLGVSQDVGDLWTLRAGVQYTNWAVLGNAPLSGAAGAAVTPATGGAYLPFNYKDAWMFSTGAEYKLRPDTTLRAGIGYETSPISNTNRSFRLPDSDRIWLSAGASYAVSKQVSVDFGYSFLHGFGSQIAASTAYGGTGSVLNGPFSGSYTGNAHIVSAALKVKFE